MKTITAQHYWQTSILWSIALIGAVLIGHHQAQAQVAIPTKQLTIEKTGNGTGTVQTVPAGIDCGSTCESTFSEGSVVTLQATATPGHVFLGFGGDQDCADGTITMDTDKTCTATFEIPIGTHTFWTAIFGSNDIFYLLGKVGIGTETPQAPLDVVGNIKADAFCLGEDCRTQWPEITATTGQSNINPVLIPDTETGSPELRQLLLEVSMRQKQIESLKQELQKQQNLIDQIKSLF